MVQQWWLHLKIGSGMKKVLYLLVIIVLSGIVPLKAQDIDLAKYDSSLENCDNDFPCSRLARWQCMSLACDEQGNKNPTDCYSTFKADKTVADQAICQAVTIMSEENIQAVLSAIPEAKLEDIVQGLVMMRAIKDDENSCHHNLMVMEAKCETGLENRP